MQAQEYQQQCETFVKEWIDKNTWHKSKDISVHNFEFVNADLSISVKNRFKVKKWDFNYGTLDKIKKDSIKDLGQDFRDKIYTRDYEYTSAIQRTLSTCHSNENLKILYDILQKSDYGIFKKDTVFKINNERIIHKYKCPQCMGKGTIKCSCKNGLEKCDAWSCDKGRVKKTERKNGHTRTFYEDCNKCKGRGWKTCSRCNGSTFVKCYKCSGSGILQESTITTCNTIPTYTLTYTNEIDEKYKQAIHQIGTPNLATITTLERKSISKIDKAVVEEYNGIVPLATFCITIKRKKYDWLVVGQNLQIIENGDIHTKYDTYRILIIILAIISFLGMAFYFIIMPDISASNTISDTQNIVKLLPQSGFVNLRQSPNGKVIAKIYIKDVNNITIKKLDDSENWVKVLYFPPNVTDENQAIMGYIHNSKIDTNLP